MNKDFTLDIYEDLLKVLQKKKFVFLTVKDYLVGSKDKNFVILRHDVDKKAYNSLETAKIEAKLNIKSTYYFRITKGSRVPSVIEKIRDLGHEIGYHYEDLTLAKGNYEKAFKLFFINLNYFKVFYPVKTICMHGSPTSKWDNKSIWNLYNYKNLGLIGEPYIDIDYSNIQYLTDTGRTWNNKDVSLRDKVKSNKTLNVKTTAQLMEKIENNQIHSNIAITTHPQRWTNNIMEWYWELVLQTIKNRVKYLLVKIYAH